MKALGPSTPISPKFNIQFLATKKISCLCHEPSNSRMITPPNIYSPLSPNLCPTHTPSTPPPWSGIPVDYHEFHKVFSGAKADTLPPHWPYNLQVSLEEGVKPFHSLIYSLSPPELVALQEFLEHTQNGFIHPTKSLWGSSVLFVKKKDGSLCLCVNFCILNKVMEKDCYPLPLIMDLLNAPAVLQQFINDVWGTSWTSVW